MSPVPLDRPTFGKLKPPPTVQTGQVPDVTPKPIVEAVIPKPSEPESKTNKGKKRRKTLRIKSCIEALLDQPALGLDYEPILHPVTKQPMTFEEAIALGLTVKAANGDKDATKEILDRMLGKAPQSLDVHQHGTIETTERVSDIARQHINEAAERAAASTGDGRPEVSRLRPDMDRSDNRAKGSKESAS